jgi:hypothetical protein
MLSGLSESPASSQLSIPPALPLVRGDPASYELPVSISSPRVIMSCPDFVHRDRHAYVCLPLPKTWSLPSFAPVAPLLIALPASLRAFDLAEGPWDQVVTLIGQAHTLLHNQGNARVHTDIRIGSRCVTQTHVP